MQFSATLPTNFFEDVQIHPLSHRGGKYNVETTGLQIISHQFDYRGSKIAFEPGEPPFWLRHEQAFDGACQIFERLFQHKPDLFACFHDEQKTWNAFLVTSRRFHPYATELAESFDPILDERLHLELSRFRQYFEHYPVIGSFNSYEVNQHPKFYYLIATPFNTGSESFLTLDNFTFKREEDKSLFIQKPATALQQLVIQICESFKKEEKEFNELLNRIAGQSIAADDFGPVVLDLYDINRNQESVANDSRLQQRIRRMMQAATDFLPTYQSLLPWTNFIQFIIRNNEVDLNSGLRQDEVEELFSRKRSYSKFESLFTKFLKDPARYQRYIEDQQADWQAISKLI